jgi:hypothetical protein
VVFISYGIIIGAIPLIWGAWHYLRDLSANISDRRFWFFLFWIGPASIFYIFIHIRQHGHIFTFLPAIYLLVSVSTLKLGQYLNERFKVTKSTHVLVPVILIPNILFFLTAPASLFGSNQLPLQTPSWLTISQRDKYLENRITAIRDNFDPADTIVLAGGIDFRHIDYYLPDYQETDLSYNLNEDYLTLPDNVTTLVLFNDQYFSLVTVEIDWKDLYLSDGTKISYVKWENDQLVRLNHNAMVIEAR